MGCLHGHPAAAPFSFYGRSHDCSRLAIPALEVVVGRAGRAVAAVHARGVPGALFREEVAGVCAKFAGVRVFVLWDAGDCGGGIGADDYQVDSQIGLWSLGLWLLGSNHESGYVEQPKVAASATLGIECDWYH